MAREVSCSRKIFSQPMSKWYLFMHITIKFFKLNDPVLISTYTKSIWGRFVFSSVLGVQWLNVNTHAQFKPNRSFVVENWMPVIGDT